MARTRWTWNIREFEQIRRSPAMMSKLSRASSSIRSSCGAGYTSSTAQGRTRARAVVSAYTYDARRDNARNNTLLKRLDSGRSS